MLKTSGHSPGLILPDNINQPRRQQCIPSTGVDFDGLTPRFLTTLTRNFKVMALISLHNGVMCGLGTAPPRNVQRGHMDGV